MAKKINNEKVYRDYDIINYTANTNREYYVTDEVQLEKDGYVLKQAVHQYSDLYPIPGSDKVVTAADHIEMQKRAYARAVRMLKAQRPDEAYQFVTTALPRDLYVGDKIRFIYTKYETTIDECGNLVEKEVLNIDKYMYVTKIVYNFDDALNETDTITLDPELRVNDFNAPELELADKDDGDISSNTIGEYKQEVVRTAIKKN